MNSDAYHAFMMDHAGGALSAELALAAELHILLSERARETAEIWRAARAEICHQRGVEIPLQDRRIPEALELARREFATVPWRKGLSGVHFAKRGKGKGKLMRLDPGQSAPDHNHSALEATVVLRGAFEDGHGQYTRGDLALAHPGLRHRPAAVGADMCICYVAQAPLAFWRFS